MLSIFSQGLLSFFVPFIMHISKHNKPLAGAIMGDGDRTRAPFLVLGLSP